MPEAAKSQTTAADLSAIKQELVSGIAAAKDAATLDSIRVKALGKSGKITELMKTLGTLPPEQRKEFGASLNILKTEIAAQIDARQTALAASALQSRVE